MNKWEIFGKTVALLLMFAIVVGGCILMQAAIPEKLQSSWKVILLAIIFGASMGVAFLFSGLIIIGQLVFKKSGGNQ